MAESAVILMIVIMGGGILVGGAFLLLGAYITQIEGRTYGRALGATALSTVAGIPVTLVLMPFFPIGWILGVPLGFALNALVVKGLFRTTFGKACGAVGVTAVCGIALMVFGLGLTTMRFR